MGQGTKVSKAFRAPKVQHSQSEPSCLHPVMYLLRPTNRPLGVFVVRSYVRCKRHGPSVRIPQTSLPVPLPLHDIFLEIILYYAMGNTRALPQRRVRFTY